MKNTLEFPFAASDSQEYTKLSSKWRVVPVTVCVASIFNNSSILGASDRMLTAGDIQFQPRSTKIWSLTNSMVAMMAGDMGLQAEIYQEMVPVINAQISTNPNTWLTVREMTDLYSRTYYEFRLRRCERAILCPLGLNRETFLSRQHELFPNIVEELTTKMNRFRMPEVGVIITGIDGPPPTAHIYTVENGEIHNHDAAGFAALGAGYWHANSQFMFAGHTRTATTAQALLNTFWAKKRAEVAPGVGTETDMFMAGPALGTLTGIREEVIQQMERIHRQRWKRLQVFNRKTENAVTTYLETLVPEAQAQVPTPPPPIPPDAPPSPQKILLDK